jgi:alkanesulfonate monooxygenase SsuD/methylene tetrahydromethanopterin reductase-like flavin-dependent oxidoreductase (luciferase family)
MIQIGIDSFATLMAPPSGGASVTPAERLRNLIGEIELADQVGLDAFGVGEHHRREFVDSARSSRKGSGRNGA